MKKIILTATAVFAISFASAQDRNIVTLSPLGFVNKVKFKYEHSLNDKISVGSFASMYYGLFPGLQIAPFGRYYFGEESPVGVYLQAKLLAGFHKYQYENYDYNLATGEINYSDKSFTSVGGGLGIGYQILTGRNKNIAIDVAIGFKLMTPPPSQSNTLNYIDVVDTGLYSTTGPGSFYDGLLSLGLSF